MIPLFDNLVCSGPKPKPGVWITPPSESVPPQCAPVSSVDRIQSVGRLVGRCVKA